MFFCLNIIHGDPPSGDKESEECTNTKERKESDEWENINPKLVVKESYIDFQINLYEIKKVNPFWFHSNVKVSQESLFSLYTTLYS